MFQGVVQVICQSVTAVVPLVESISSSSASHAASECTVLANCLTSVDWKKQKSEDGDVAMVIDLLRTGFHPGGRH